ncbi:hypothetical protein WJR50_10005, partial [Catalinimonas sp. 4WD22]|uniref:hypothetical protein n=1 Tax=Catalinimonas locisalis TaxID=3133978 RepID=UPI0031013BAC
YQVTHISTTQQQLILLRIFICNKPKGISMDDIAGNWIATYARFSNNQLNPPIQINVVDEGGTVNLVIQSNGRFTFTISFPGETPDVSKGQLGFDEDYLVVHYDGDAADDYEYMGIQLSQDQNTLVISGPAEYDFNEDGTEEPAQLRLELVRN